MINSLRITLKQLKSTKKKQLNDIQQLQEVLEAMQRSLNKLAEDIESRQSNAIENMAQKEKELCEQESSRLQFADLAVDLLEKAADMDVITKGGTLPTPASLLGTKQYRHTWYDLESNLEDMVAQVGKMIAKCRVVERKKTLVSAGPVKKCNEISRIQGKSEIYGMCLFEDGGSKQIAVRTKDLICVYNYFGDTMMKLGGENIRKTCSGIGVDTKRSLFLVPCHNKMATYTMLGIQRDEIPLPGDLHGVTYVTSEDAYVVSVADQHKLLVIDAGTKRVRRQIGSKGSEADGFFTPDSLTTFDSGIPMLAVVDYGNSRIKVCDLNGRSVRIYGTEGREDGQLDNPWDVCVDPANRLLVCDAGNKLLASFWDEGAEQKWQLVLQIDDKGIEPRCLAFDVDERLLFVATDGDTINVYSCP